MTEPELIERITSSTPRAERLGHELRYRLAAGYIDADTHVLDAGCGTGYGSLLLGPCNYIGVDIADTFEPQPRLDWPLRYFMVGDLGADWEPFGPFDVALAFEVIEHVTNTAHLIDVLCQARQLVIASVPIIPTVGMNPYHVHDFTVDDLPPLFAARGFTLEALLLQPAEESAIYVFRRQ